MSIKNITGINKADTEEAIFNIHTHDNKSILDENTEAFTSELKTNYDLAYAQSLKHNQSINAPTTTNDETQGYKVGSQWLKTDTNILYECKDATTGSAVWVALPFTAPFLISAEIENTDGTSLVAGDLIRIKENGKIENIKQTIAGTGTGLVDVGAPNFNDNITSLDFTNTSGNYFITLPTLGSIIGFGYTNQYSTLQYKVWVGQKDGVDINWGDYKTPSNYAVLSYAFKDYKVLLVKHDETRCFAIGSVNSNGYLYLLPIEIENDLQIKRVGSLKLITTSITGANNFDSLSQARGHGNYHLVIANDTSQTTIYVNQVKFEPDNNDTTTITALTDIVVGSTSYNSAICFYVGQQSNGTKNFVILLRGSSGAMYEYLYTQTSSSVGFTLTASTTSITVTVFNFFTNQTIAIPYKRRMTSLNHNGFYILGSQNTWTDGSYKRFNLYKFTSSGVSTVSTTDTEIASTIMRGHSTIGSSLVQYRIKICNPSVGIWCFFTFTERFGARKMIMQCLTINESTGDITTNTFGDNDYIEILNETETNVESILQIDCLYQNDDNYGNEDGYCTVPYLYYNGTEYRPAYVRVQMDGSTIISIQNFNGIAQQGGDNGDIVQYAPRGSVSSCHTDKIPGADYYIDTLTATLTTTYTPWHIGYASSTTTIILQPKLINNTTANTTIPYYISNPQGTNRFTTDFYGENAIIANNQLKMTIGGNYIKYYNLPTVDPLILNVIYKVGNDLQISNG
jgi:hypothetical protein